MSETLTELNQLVEKIQADPELDIQEFDASFFSNRKSSFTEVTSPKREGESPVCTVDKNGYTFRLKHPAYITVLELIGDKPARRPSIKIEMLPISDDPAFTVKTTNSDENQNAVEAEVYAIVRGFKVSVDSWNPFTKSEKITRIAIYGLSLSDQENLEAGIRLYLDREEQFRQETTRVSQTLKTQSDEIAKKIAEHEAALGRDKKALADQTKAAQDAMAKEKASHAEAIAKLESDAGEKQEALDSLSEQCTQKIAETQQLDAKKAQISKQLDELKSLIESQTQKERDIDQRIAEKTSDLALKTKQVTDLNDQLQTLSNDVSLFAENTIGHAKQGDAQKQTYLRWIIAPSLAMFGIAVAAVVYTAWELFEIFVKNPQMDIWKLIGLRVPFMGALAAFFPVLYKFNKPFVSAILNIDERKSRLLEISILARDTSDAVLYGEDVTNEERRNNRLAIRMKLIRDYFTGKLAQTPATNSLAEVFNQVALPKKDAATPKGLTQKASQADGAKVSVGNSAP